MNLWLCQDDDRPKKKNGNDDKQIVTQSRPPSNRQLSSKAFYMIRYYIFEGTRTQRERVKVCWLESNTETAPELCNKMMKVLSSVDIQMEEHLRTSSTLSIYCKKNKTNKQNKTKIHTAHFWMLTYSNSQARMALKKREYYTAALVTQRCRRSWKPIKSKENK